MKKYSEDELILRATKEVMVKFIEMGRISPAGFTEHFKNIYQTIETTVKKQEEVTSPAED